jgi:pteridine reductase
MSVTHSLAGRVALVTGAAHRVGKAIAVALAERGARVAVHYHAAQHEAESTLQQLRARGVEASAFKSDLSDASACPTLIADVVRHFGSLDILVNSAAIMQRTPIGEVTPSDWDTMFAVNLRAPFFLAQAASPHLARSRGVIVNIADLAAFETWPAYVPHTITKAGVVQMTRALAHALAPDVRVNAVAPGAVLLPDGWDERSTQHLIDTTPLKRLGTPEDVVRAVVYLIESDYVTGETMLVDGGRHVRT